MDKELLLKLDETPNNLKIISNNLENCHFFDSNYYLLYIKKVRILKNAKRYNEALTDIYNLLPYLNELDEDIADLVLETILDLSYTVNRFDEYSKYLEMRSKRIRASKSYIIIYDKFRYYYGLKDFNQAIILAKDYLNYDLSSNERIKVLEDLLNIVEQTKDFNLYTFTKNELNLILRNNFDQEKEKEVLFKELDIVYFLKEEKETHEIIKNLLENFELTNDEKVIVSSILIDFKLIKNELNKAVIIESDYNEYLEGSSLDNILRFSNIALTLYKKLNHKVSIEYYENLIEETQTKIEKINKKNKNKTIIIPDVKVNHKKEIVKEFETIEIVKKNKEIDLSSSVIKVLNFIDEIKDKEFREVFRQFGIKFHKDFNFVEANILFYDNLYYFHTFKNGRVFDRTYDSLEDSMQKELFAHEEEIFVSETLNRIDLFTKKEVLYKHAYKFNLTYDEKYLGCLILFSNEENSDFDTLYLFVRALNYLLINNVNHYNLDKENRIKNYLFEVSNFGFKKICHNNLYLSEGLKKAYNKNYSFLEEFYNELDSQTRIKYQEIINVIREHKVNDKQIIYRLNNHYYKEIFVPFVYKDEFLILCLVLNYDFEFNKIKELTDLCYKNETKNIYNFTKFRDNVLKSEDNTIILFTASNLENYIDIYGYDFYIEFLNELSNILNHYFYHNFIITYYHLKEEVFGLIIENKVDKRVINSMIKNFINYLEVSFENFKFGFSPKFYAGIYRLQDYKKSNFEDILKYAYFALNDSYNSDNNISFFNLDSYKLNLESKIIYKEISEAINNNNLEVNYNMVADIKNLEVYGYYGKLNLKTEIYEESKIEEIIRKRNLISNIDKYKITQILLNMKNLYQQINGLFYMFFDINSNSIDKNFISFLDQHLRYFKIPGNFIYIIVDKYIDILDDLKKLNINIITKDIFDILNDKTSYLALDYNMLKLEAIDDLILFLNKKSAEIFLYNVSCKIKELALTNVRYVTGSVYNKRYLISDIIDNIKKQ